MPSYAELLDILYEDNHLLVVNKPSGWPTTHFGGQEETVDRLVKEYLKEKYQKPGNVFLGVVHRLDKPVSGVLIFARTSKAASRLGEQFRAGAVEKIYWAVIEDSPQSRTQFWNAEHGSFDDWLIHSEASREVRVVAKEHPDAKHARLLYSVRNRIAGLIWLELRPHTGRKHQLRVQLANRGFPIIGDIKYGSPHRFGNAIALHARSVTFLHPTKNEPITIQADVPSHWRGRFAHLLHQAKR